MSEQQNLTVGNKPAMSFLANLYLIRTRRNRYVVYVDSSTLKVCEGSEGNHIREFIRRMVKSRNGVIRWLGRVSRTGHHYYQIFEDKIDPLERMLKAINFPDRLNIHHSNEVQAEAAFRTLLKKQEIKHTVWLFVDSVFTLIVVMLAPILVPIPGPNLFFYYPALRLLSHYRAMTGARRGLTKSLTSFNELPELARLEENLQASYHNENVRATVGDLDIEGLDEFLGKVS